jgi:uncharacterized protein
MSDELKEMRRRLSEARDDLIERYPIRRLGLFGSVVRGDHGPESDVDVLVEFSRPVGLEIVDLAEELEAVLGRRVDLVSRKAISDRMLPHIEKDLIYV